MERINQNEMAKLPGEILKNGAIIIAMRWLQVEEKLMKGLVLAISSKLSPHFVVWRREVAILHDSHRRPYQTEDTWHGHYFLTIDDALNFFNEQVEEETHEKANIESISNRGFADGKNAAEWWLDPNMQLGKAQAILKGIEDGDPAVMDQLPEPRLGGEFAGDPTWEDIVRDETDIRELSDDGENELMEHYEETFRRACEETIVSHLKGVIESFNIATMRD